MALERELAAFRTMLAALLPEHSGEWAVIRGDQLIGISEFYEDALKVGYDHSGLTGFLVKQILAVEPVLRFTRDLGPDPRLAEVEQIVRDYHFARDDRRASVYTVGCGAEVAAIDAIQAALGMPWVAGEETERRKATAGEPG